MSKAVKGNVINHHNICEELNKLYEEKDQRYGNSFSATYSEYGPVTLLVRLEDKLNRAKSLIMQGLNGDDESIRDTLIDLANYAILGVMELDRPTEVKIAEEGYVKVHNVKLEPIEEEDVVLEEIIAELEEYNKTELFDIAKALGMEVAKKITKPDLITTIVKDNSPEDIANTIDDLFDGEED